ncbi:MAG: hypothetical protein CVU55_00210 [Deltaproteobacteria bacterium HGW-Deltaproteobacteria-13]|jgi:hypothetical protein|nr:MAG: hypothetical protein CVU55_00210 [Deltaproteobacteria bacterium HGW-Deltaproteobacteria-13]
MYSNKNKKVIYTCITGNYDQLNNHSYIHPHWDYVCFTDDLSAKNSNNSSWEIRPLAFNNMDNVRNNRWHKLHPHILFPEYERSIYVDANINFISDGLFADIDAAVRESRKISLAPHFSRKCIYDELDACLKFEKDDPDVMKEQIDLIKKDGFPENYGLFEGNIIYREHHDQDVIKIMRDWWWWIENYSRRDQLSFTYVLWKNNFRILPLSDIPYRRSKKISLWTGSKHATKEELIRRKKIFSELFKKIKKNNSF